MNFNACQTSQARSRRGFTLIELLIVIGLSAVLFALLLIPLISALNYTRQAQSLTAMQDAVRVTREELTRELGSALYVFDNTSHPFKTTNPVGGGDERYTNFLSLQIVDSAGSPVVAHAYNAKLDFVQPKLNDKGLAIDPTTGEPVTYRQSVTNSGSAIIANPSFVFPAAAGTTMIRYWVGLKDPSQPYNNTREGKAANNTDNTYILYRAQFSLSNPLDPATKKPIVNADGTTINERLFVPKHDAGGNPTNEPELDDPDFFRYVNLGIAADPNWLDDAHAAYPAQDAIGSAGTPGSAAQHNNRVEQWRTLAKPVIPGPNVDLLLLPHNSDNTLSYDTGAPGPCTAAGCPGTAHSGIAHDPVADKYYPIVSTSVTFRPGVVSGDATPATTADYTSAGAPTQAGNTGVGYIPTVYTTGNQSWTQPYRVTLTPPAAPAGSGQSASSAEYYIAPDPTTGDLMEYSGTYPSGTAVFDVSTGVAATGQDSYIPLTIKADTGALNFATPALLDPAADRYKREWVYSVSGGAVDLKTKDNNNFVSPLSRIQEPTLTDDSGNPILTARIVPGSVRVYGPDATAGPSQGQRVLYTEAGVGTPGAVTTENQYTVNYATGVLTFTGADNNAQFASLPSPAGVVTVLYDYQANMAPVGALDTGSKLSSYSLMPFGVSVDYQTRDLISVSIGLRIYDISTGRAQVIPSETKIKIGNSNR